jgi:hypothetical protein
LQNFKKRAKDKKEVGMELFIAQVISLPISKLFKLSKTLVLGNIFILMPGLYSQHLIFLMNMPTKSECLSLASLRSIE